MRIKKGLALFLALAMIICLMPASAFASTTATVDKVYAVAADTDMPEVYIDLKVTSPKGIAKNEVNKFKLNLENAEWTLDTVNDTEIAKAVKLTDLNGENIGTLTATATSETATTLTFTASKAIAKDEYIRLALKLISGTDEGAVKVAIDGLDSAVSSQTLTVANVGSGTTKAVVTGKVKTYERQDLEAATVEISETAVNSITTSQIVKMTLPKGITWKGVHVSGDLLGVTAGNASFGLDESDAPNDSALKYYLTNDDRTMYLNIPVKNDDKSRQSIVITPKVTIGKDAVKGDIALNIAGYKATDGKNLIADESDLLIAKYGDEAVTVSTADEENLPEIVAGYLQDKKDKEFVLQVTFKESLPGSLVGGRFIDFDLPDEVQVVDSKPIKAYVGTGSSSYTKNSVSASSAIDISEGTAKDRSEFTFTVPSVKSGLSNWDPDKANTLTLYIPVTVQADFSGDIKMNIKGARAGVEDTDLVVGKVISPITVTADITKVVNGAQNQATADITIKENIPGYLTSDNKKNGVELLVDTLNLSNGVSFTDATAEVTEGDLLIKNFDADGTTMTFEIKDTSTKVSTIKISDVKVAMSRILPEGKYDLKVAGSALIENGVYNDDAFSTKENVYAATVPYINITTGADSQEGINATFVVGESKYTNNGVEVVMDAASYIANNRTYVPIRYIANACGVSDSDIVWSDANRTVTLTGENTVVKLTVGSNIIQTSTGTVTADVPVVIKDNRTYLPARFVANAFGAEVTWDNATRTVTIAK